MSIIEIKNLTHSFPGGVRGLDRVSLTVEKGEFVIIAGRNGSGKTTLLRHLNGLLTPREGEVRVSGIPVSRDPAAARRRVGMVFQDADSQIVGETVYEDTAFGPQNLGLGPEEIDRRVRAALKTTGLSDLAQRPAHLLSGGEKRRLAIAGILAMEPEIIVFDEPFANLDYPGIRAVIRQMLIMKENGRAIILTTHDPHKVLPHADRLVIMENGAITASFKPGEEPVDLEKFGVMPPGPFSRKQVLDPAGNPKSRHA
ncbi:Energy-coupling factor transporter ATP-binding protein EcfA [Candidatus Desulfarcum epimagneticum]|uniref:Energy-coupling factor transporter ATP-binding protein EcfA n=1 Tax=uncultured Desulfobacteraceae bacterium TaxID=218296 RepID=A0A484HKI9_9BACT|nr:Energy-coupling factor transporter ATP-binding protein EcfA [uncultured Desulfobacteraceae bacterium]